ncbi:uncharacterized protein [Apostichopus japonicus]|uniref:uncharacterized protein isoform X3 n=1 Tax=Stichopus japonicus TaxID=307972 RepID=UPI003AB5DE5C
METNGDAETKEHEALDEQGGGEQDETETEAAEVKTEPQEVEMKDYAEDTMNELLGIYGYDGMDKSLTENLQLQHFASEDQEGGTSAVSVKQEEGAPDVSKKSEEMSPGKPTDKSNNGARRRSSSSSGYHLRELKTSPASATAATTAATTATSAKSCGSSALVNGRDKTLMNQYKTKHKKKQRTSTYIASPVVDKKRKRHDSSSSEDSLCSCGTCDLDHDGGSQHRSHHVDIIREIQKILDENKSLRRENKRLKAELTDTFSSNVKQLSQNIRQLTSQLQGGTGGLPLSRPPSTGSACSGTPLKVNGSGKKPVRVKQQRQEDFGEHEGDEDEELEENAAKLWPDSGILLPSSRIQTALQTAQQNYRLFTRSLMEMVFTKETMAASSARGQKAMGKNSMENASPRPPLDQNAVQAIVSRVCSEFPEVHQTLVMGVIRQKIADVRKRLKIQSIRESAHQESV